MGRQSLNDVFFDYSEYFESLFSMTSVTMWSTRYPAFTFAFYLNQLYGLELERRDDIVVSNAKKEIPCSVFSYQRNVDQLVFFLIENDPNSTQEIKQLSYFDKILLIMGPDAEKYSMNIYNDIMKPKPNSMNIAEIEREQLCKSFIENGIVEMGVFDFTDANDIRTNYFSSPATNETTKKKRLKFLQFYREYMTDLFVGLDELIPNFEDDKVDYECSRKANNI